MSSESRANLVASVTTFLRQHALIVLLLAVTVFSRFIKPDWGDGYFFHPDENNMAVAVSNLGQDGLNPHFFAYGQLPLYLSYFSLKIINLPPVFPNAVFSLRILSAIFSAISVLIFFYLSRLLLGANVAKIAAFLFVLTPGLIQISHFGTTESLLVLVFLVDLYLSLKLLDSPYNIRLYLLIALATGLGLGAKISALIFLTPFFIVTTINFFSQPRLKIIFLASYTLLFTLILFIISSPYNLIDNLNFLSALRYETDVATGRLPVFYTRQFIGTAPYIFQFKYIFPYIVGIPIFVLSLPGLLWQIKNRNFKILFLSCLVYFLYFGQLHVKWTRFMSPLFPIFPLLAAAAVSKINHYWLKWFLILICVLPGVIFLSLYYKPDIRVEASQWINDNIPRESVVLSEGGNVVDLPVSTHSLNVSNFDFYSLDDNPQNRTRLTRLIYAADYIIVPSRRVFKNHTGGQFPVSANYYQALFAGDLGFEQITHFYPRTDLFLNPENAEETWSVFDRPDIRIYKKVKPLSLEEIESILKI